MSVEQLREIWGIFFGFGVIGGAVLFGWAFVERQRIKRLGNDSILRVQANTLVLEALLIWVCAALGQLAAIGSIFALSMITLLSLVGFGLMFNVLIVAIILGKLAVSRTLRRYHESLRQLKKDSPVPAAGGPH